MDDADAMGRQQQQQQTTGGRFVPRFNQAAKTRPPDF
jgi:hypothetical protein